MKNFMGKEGFYWWQGVVEDRMDPLKIGRCRVRILGIHTDDKSSSGIPTKDLPWAMLMIPPNSDGNIVPPREGTWVMGFFRDSENTQDPVIIGVLPGINEEVSPNLGKAPSEQLGFFDPVGIDNKDDLLSNRPINIDLGFTDSNGVSGKIVPIHGRTVTCRDIASENIVKQSNSYPKTTGLKTRIGEPDTHRLSRNDSDFDPQEFSSLKWKIDNFISQISTAASGVWSEPNPETTYNSVYPYNNVIESESGHIFEVDDTLNSERIHTFHRSGTFDEFISDGSRIQKTIGDSYRITYENDNILVVNSQDTTIGGNRGELIFANSNTVIGKNQHTIVHGLDTRSVRTNMQTWVGTGYWLGVENNNYNTLVQNGDVIFESIRGGSSQFSIKSDSLVKLNGQQSVQLKGGTSIVSDAGSTSSHKAGSNYTIDASSVLINCGGGIPVSDGASAQSPSSGDYTISQPSSLSPHEDYDGHLFNGTTVDGQSSSPSTEVLCQQVSSVSSQVTSLDSTFSSAVADINAKISTQEISFASENEAIAQRIDTLQTSFNSDVSEINATITDDRRSYADEFSAIVTTIGILQSVVETGDTTALTEVVDRLDAISNTNTSIINSVSTLRTQFESNTSSIIASLSDAVNVLSSEDQSIINSVSTVTSKVSNNEIYIEEHTTAINGLQGEWGISVDDNGKISGIKLLSSNTSSEFIVKADVFKVIDPDSEDEISPFMVDNGTVKITGSVVFGLPKTSMESDFISEIDGKADSSSLGIMSYQDTVVIYNDGSPGDGSFDGQIWIDTSDNNQIYTWHGLDSTWVPGKSGTDGVDGNDGLTAYEQWFMAGNMGSEQDFLNSLIGSDGKDGSDGLPGTDGTDGITYYTWIKYANSGDGSDGFSNSPTDKVYLGLAFNQITATESDDPDDYNWTLIKGSDGTDGTDGITYYTWIRYANSIDGVDGFSNDPSGKSYIGFAFNQTTPTESVNPGDYSWTLMKGSDGLPGTPGSDGITYYTWIKYANSDDGSDGFSNDPAGKLYLGLAYNQTDPTESENPAHYNWTLIKGTDGITHYTWIRYANSIDGSDGFSNDPVGKTHIGLAFNQITPTESEDAADYNWALIKGSDGTDGISITWKEESETPPSNPQENWVYRDRNDGITYIFNGSEWVTMTVDGNDGENGTDGFNIDVQYSSDQSSWHEVYGNDDKYIRQSIDGGDNWTDAIKFVGDNGTDGESSLFISILSSSEGFVFKNNSGLTKTLTATVYDMGTGNEITSGISYQWYKNGVSISGATSSTISVTATDIPDGSSSQYSCSATVS